MKITIKRNTIALLFWTVAIIAFAFQCYFRTLSSLIVPCLALFLIFEFSSMNFGQVRGWLTLYAAFFIYLGLSVVVALFNSGVNSSTLRFFLILAVIPLAGLIEENDFKLEWKVFQVIMVARILPAIYKWIGLFISQDYTQDRLWARSNGVGDIYIINGIPRVQLVGSSLFVMAFLIDLYKKRKITPFGILMIIGALITGNSAYILGIAVGFFFFFLPTLNKWRMGHSWKALIVIPLIIVGIILFVRFSISTMGEKSATSNIVRIEQARILLDTNPAIGDGLGHQIYGTAGSHIYSGDNTYFELQTLYIFNQIGTIGLILFYVLTISVFLGKQRPFMLYLYLSYLIYSFFNPYCFDSTHIMVMVLISNSNLNMDIDDNDIV